MACNRSRRVSRQRENATHDHTLVWPRPFAGLRGVKVADLPRAIPAGITLAAMIIYRFGAPLYFANASLLEEEVDKLLKPATTPVKWLVLDMQAMVDIDTSGAEVLEQVLSRMADSGVTVVISRANQPTTALLEQYRLLGLIGENRLYPTNRHAIAAFRQEHEQRERLGPRR